MNNSNYEHWRKLFDQKWLGSWDLPADGSDLVVTITNITKEDVTNEQGTKPCVIAHIKGNKPMIVNVGNAYALEQLTGTDNHKEWKNVKIALTSEKRRNPRKIGPRFVKGLKIRTQAPKLPTLTPKHADWEMCRNAILDGNCSVDQLRSRYTIPEKHVAALIAIPAKEELTPDHDRWAGALSAIQDGKTTINDIKKVFSLTAENEELLCTK